MVARKIAKGAGRAIDRACQDLERVRHPRPFARRVVIPASVQAYGMHGALPESARLSLAAVAGEPWLAGDARAHAQEGPIPYVAAGASVPLDLFDKTHRAANLGAQWFFMRNLVARAQIGYERWRGRPDYYVSGPDLPGQRQERSGATLHSWTLGVDALARTNRDPGKMELFGGVGAAVAYQELSDVRAGGATVELEGHARAVVGVSGGHRSCCWRVRFRLQASKPSR